MPDPTREQQIAQRAEANLQQQVGALMFRLALAEAEIQQLRAELAKARRGEGGPISDRPYAVGQ